MTTNLWLCPLLCPLRRKQSFQSFTPSVSLSLVFVVIFNACLKIASFIKIIIICGGWGGYSWGSNLWLVLRKVQHFIIIKSHCVSHFSLQPSYSDLIKAFLISSTNNPSVNKNDVCNVMKAKTGWKVCWDKKFSLPVRVCSCHSCLKLAEKLFREVWKRKFEHLRNFIKYVFK